MFLYLKYKLFYLKHKILFLDFAQLQTLENLLLLGKVYYLFLILLQIYINLQFMY